MMSAQMTARSLELLDKDAAISLCSMGRIAAREHADANVALPPYPREPRVEADYSRSPSRGRIPPGAARSASGREPRVPFEEMKRLMRVYGPLKCLRNRTPRESGRSTKALSVKRKFYRWFPDFHMRFALQAGGWYLPIGGHREEMRYREELRRRDQDALTVKRKRKRAGAPPSGETLR